MPLSKHLHLNTCILTPLCRCVIALASPTSLHLCDDDEEEEEEEEDDDDELAGAFRKYIIHQLDGKTTEPTLDRVVFVDRFPTLSVSRLRVTPVGCFNRKCKQKQSWTERGESKLPRLTSA